MSGFHEAFNGNNDRGVVLPDEVTLPQGDRMTPRLAGYRDPRALNPDGTMPPEMMRAFEEDGVRGEIRQELAGIPEFAGDDNDDENSLAKFQRSGVFGWMQRHKKLFGVFMLFGAFGGVAHQAHAAPQAPSHSGGGGGPMPNGYSFNTPGPDKVVTTTEHLHLSDTTVHDYSHAKHFGTGETAEKGPGSTASSAVEHQQQQLADRIHALQAAGYDVKIAHHGSVVSETGGASQEFDTHKFAGSHGVDAAHGLNDNLAEARGADAAYNAMQDLNQHGHGDVRVEVGHANHDTVLVRGAHGLERVNFSDDLKAHNLTQADFNKIAHQINTGHHDNSAAHDYVKATLDLNRSAVEQVTTDADLVVTQHIPTTITHEAPQPPHHDQQKPTPVVPFPDVWARRDDPVEKKRPEPAIKEQLEPDPDPVPPVIFEPPWTDDPPPPPPPGKKRTFGDSDYYSKHVSKGGGNVRAAGFRGGVHQGGVTRVEGGIPRAKNEFSARPREQSVPANVMSGLKRAAEAKFPGKSLNAQKLRTAYIKEERKQLGY